MIKELHGKHYYMELEEFIFVEECLELILNSEALHNEKFEVMKRPNGNLVIFSKAKCEEFRGEKYREWEKIKRNIYTLKKQRT